MHHPPDLRTRHTGFTAKSGCVGLCSRNCGFHHYSLWPLPLPERCLKVLDAVDTLLHYAGGLHSRWLSEEIIIIVVPETKLYKLCLKIQPKFQADSTAQNTFTMSCFCMFLHRGSESEDWYRGPVTHCSAETGSLTGAHADHGWLVWCPPSPHRFPGRGSLPAALSGPAASRVKGLHESSPPLIETLSIYLSVSIICISAITTWPHLRSFYYCYLQVMSVLWK